MESTISRDDIEELKAFAPVLRMIQEYRRRRQLEGMYLDDGLLRRELYPKHLQFFAAGNDHRERLFLAGNRVGKTWGVGAYELSLHLTGLYPDWWKGKRFSGPINAWAAGDTSKTVLEVVQRSLLGAPGDLGTGMIPADRVLRTTSRAGLADAIETAWVRWHESPKKKPSTLTLKSYEMGREAFQGATVDVIWLDEEPPMAIYTECVMRTMTTQGLIMLTFTPLLGVSEVVRQFLPDGIDAVSNSETGGRV